jgi:trk system potassium uptake protein TrkA
MKQFAIIGLGQFGCTMLEQLSDTGCEILIIDKDREAVEKYKGKATAAYIADAISEEIVVKLIPATIDAAVVDLGDNLEASILVTNYLKKLGVRRVIAKAESAQHAEILDIVGATEIVLPDREAAKRIAPLLLSSALFSYLPIGRDFAIVEMEVPDRYAGKTLIEANLRQEHRLNVIALRRQEQSDYAYFAPDYRLRQDDVLLVAAKEEDVAEFTKARLPAAKRGVPGVLDRLFTRFRGGKERGGQAPGL